MHKSSEKTDCSAISAAASSHFIKPPEIILLPCAAVPPLGFGEKEENQFRFRWDFPTWEDTIQVNRGVLGGERGGEDEEESGADLGFKMTSILQTEDVCSYFQDFFEFYLL